MFKEILEKLFCKHKWKTHEKEKYEWVESEVVYETRFWTNPVIEKTEFSQITEVLICEHCGKIKIIDY